MRFMWGGQLAVNTYYEDQARLFFEMQKPVRVNVLDPVNVQNQSTLELAIVSHISFHAHPKATLFYHPFASLIVALDCLLWCFLTKKNRVSGSSLPPEHQHTHRDMLTYAFGPSPHP